MADFTSYDQIVKWIAKGKNHAEGRKKRSFMFRMQEDVVVVSHAQRWATRRPDGSWDYKQLQWRLIDFAEITPGDVITFTLEPQEMRKIACSMSSTFWRVLGLCWVRVGTGRYNLFRYEETGKALYYQLADKNIKKYEFFKGMMWEFARGICINPRPPVHKKVDRERRRTWVGDLKRFKRAFMTRAKLGIIDQMIAERDADLLGQKGRMLNPDLDAYVLETIRTGEVTTDFIAEIIEHRANTGWRPMLTRDTVVGMLTTIINRNSVRYRQEYGVLQK